MTKLTILINFIAAILLTGCATSMTPIQVNETLPTLTKSKFISQSQVQEITETNKCKYLIRSRNYVAPIGLSTKDDLKHAAKGIDEWVKLDGGNAYVLKNYKWLTVDHNGSTQLHVEFDTMLCE
jgi:uncharacterized protein YceK